MLGSQQPFRTAIFLAAALAAAGCGLVGAGSGPAGGWGGGSAPPTGPLRLRPGESAERSLSRGEVHAYSLSLAAGDYLRAGALQQGVDLELRLVAPSGAVVAAADVLLSLYAAETLEAIAGEGGDYRLEVEALANSPAGAYRLAIPELRPAAAADRDRLAAAAAARELHGRCGQPPAGTSLEALAELCRQAAARWLEIGDSSRAAENLNRLGRQVLGRATGEDREARLSLAQRCFEEALGHWEEADNPAGQASAWKNLGEVSEQRYRFREAIQAYQRSVDLCRQAGDYRFEGGSRLSLGVVYRRLALVEEAREQYEAVLALARAEGDAALECQALNRYGTSFWNTGEFDQARDLHEQGRRRCAEARDQLLSYTIREEELSILHNLGSDYQELGYLDEALHHFEEAAERAAQLHLQRPRATAILNQGTTLLALGQKGEALERYSEALGLYTAIGDVAGQVQALTRLGWLRSSQGEDERALELFRQALAVDAGRLDPLTRAGLLHAVGTTLRTRGDLREAIAQLEAALELRRDAGDRYSEAVTLTELAEARIAAGETAAAGVHLARALALSRAMDHRLLTAVTLGRLARLSRRQGELESSERQIREALALLEYLRSEVAEPEMRATFLAQRRSHYEFLIDLSIELAEAAEPGAEPAASDAYRREALLTSERARARSLLDLLAESQVDLAAGVDPGLQQQERDLRARLSGIGKSLIDLQQAGSADPLVGERRLFLQAARRETEGRLERLEREIRRENAQLREVRYPEPLPLPEIQALLGPETALLEYALGEERSFLFVVTREGLATFTLAPAASLRSRVREVRQGLEPGGELRLPEYLLRAHELFTELLAPAEEILAAKAHLLIVPDDILFHLPFEALVTAPLPGYVPAAAAIPYLVRRWSTSYAPSASVLRSLDRARPERVEGGIELVAFGDPVYRPLSPAELAAGGPLTPVPATQLSQLPARGDEARGDEARGDEARAGEERGPWRLPRLTASQQEVLRIADLFRPGRVRVFLGTEASEENVKGRAEVARASHLHFAVHGLLGGGDGDRYGLVLDQSRLQQENAEDGLLDLREIFELRLPACDLVVLSACGSGLGKEIRGEGFVGMTHAFMSAGAPSLVVSLWRVEDESTAEFMVRFYRHLLESGDKAQALRAARLEMLAESEYPQPRHWAPFVLVGRPR